VKRRLVPAIPFAVSLALSLSMVGSEVSWQDSGLFLDRLAGKRKPAPPRNPWGKVFENPGAPQVSKEK
jgi:hypothetical protein